MEVDDGYILGIYNFCDRWCETCAFTSRCRVFADGAAMEAAQDPHLKAVVEAPPLPRDVPPPPPQWMQDLLEEMNEASREPLSPEELQRFEPRVRPEHTPIEQRARAYGRGANAWLESGRFDARDVADPRTVIGWFASFLPPKIHRALSSLDNDDDLPDAMRDSVGSAKAALIGIDRSHAAWLALVDSGQATMAKVSELVAELVWLGEALEQVFPTARDFVRPGFDEPDAVARLERDEAAGQA